MAKFIQQDQNRNTFATAGLGRHGSQIGSVAQETSDGDTISVRPIGDFGVRFLGIDTPEKSLPFRGELPFVSLSDTRWTDLLTDPFTEEYRLSEGLMEHLEPRLTPDTARNHLEHAKLAEDRLEELIQDDLEEMGATKEDFRFYMRFAFEVLDGNGRLLAFINRSQPNPQVPTPRPRDYNTRMLESGHALPYFIWPNIDPFRSGSILGAAFRPGTTTEIVGETSKLREARESVKAARENGVGVFETGDPLLLEAFEVRFLGNQVRPKRWVIDLSRDETFLHHPENYWEIPFPEDRLFINREHLPFFERKGWELQASPD